MFHVETHVFSQFKDILAFFLFCLVICSYSTVLFSCVIGSFCFLIHRIMWTASSLAMEETGVFSFCWLYILQMHTVTLTSESLFITFLLSRFLSGSRDGTARIWYFHRSVWKHILVDVSKRLLKYVHFGLNMKASIHTTICLLKMYIWSPYLSLQYCCYNSSSKLCLINCHF